MDESISAGGPSFTKRPRAGNTNPFAAPGPSPRWPPAVRGLLDLRPAGDSPIPHFERTATAAVAPAGQKTLRGGVVLPDPLRPASAVTQRGSMINRAFRSTGSEL